MSYGQIGVRPPGGRTPKSKGGQREPLPRGEGRTGRGVNTTTPKRALTFLDVLCLGVNAIIGSGIFLFPGHLAALAGDLGQIM